MIQDKNRHSWLFRTITAGLVCLFLAGQVAFAYPDALAARSGDQSHYQEMLERMHKRVDDHQETKGPETQDSVIHDLYVERMVDRIDIDGSGPLNEAFNSLITHCDARGMIDRLNMVLKSTGGMIGIAYIDADAPEDDNLSQRALALFGDSNERNVIGHPGGMSITLIARLRSGMSKEDLITEILATLVHEIMGFSTDGMEAFKREDPKTSDEASRIAESFEKERRRAERLILVARPVRLAQEAVLRGSIDTAKDAIDIDRDGEGLRITSRLPDHETTGEFSKSNVSQKADETSSAEADFGHYKAEEDYDSCINRIAKFANVTPSTVKDITSISENKTVDLKDLTIPRTSLNNPWVVLRLLAMENDEYAAYMQERPIFVVKWRDNYFVSQGKHRCAAAWLSGEESIQARIIEITDPEAVETFEANLRPTLNQACPVKGAGFFILNWLKEDLNTSPLTEPDYAVAAESILSNPMLGRNTLAGRLRDLNFTMDRTGDWQWQLRDLASSGSEIDNILALSGPQEIEAYIWSHDDLPQEKFAALIEELINSGYNYDNISSNQFWSGLGEKKQAMVRAAVERQVATAMRNICDDLYYYTFKDMDKPSIQFYDATATYMADKGYRNMSRFDVLVMPEGEMTEVARDFLADSVTNYEPHGPPGEAEIFILDNWFQANFFNERTVNNFLKRIGSNTMITLDYVQYPGTEEPVEAFQYFRYRHLEGDMILVDEELVSSHGNSLTIEGATSLIEDWTLVLYQRMRNLYRALYFRSLTGRPSASCILPDQSRAGEAVQRWILSLRGINSEEEIRQEATVEPFLEDAMLFVADHEKGHDKTWDRLEEAGYDRMEGQPGGKIYTIQHAGNGLGNLIDDMLADFLSYDSLCDIATTDDTQATVVFYQQLAALYDQAAQTNKLRSNATTESARFIAYPQALNQCYYELSIVLQCIRDDGTVDFDRLRTLCVRAYDTLLRGYLKYGNDMQDHELHGIKLIDLFREDGGEGLKSSEARSFSRWQAKEANFSFIRDLFPEKAAEVRFIDIIANDIAESVFERVQPVFLLDEARLAQRKGQFVLAVDRYNEAFTLTAPLGVRPRVASIQLSKPDYIPTLQSVHDALQEKLTEKDYEILIVDECLESGSTGFPQELIERARKGKTDSDIQVITRDQAKDLAQDTKNAKRRIIIAPAGLAFENVACRVLQVANPHALNIAVLMELARAMLIDVEDADRENIIEALLAMSMAETNELVLLLADRPGTIMLLFTTVDEGRIDMDSVMKQHTDFFEKNA